jgi:hypothetical protein
VKTLKAPILLLLAVALVLWLLAAWDARLSQRDAQIIQDAKATLALSRPFHAQIERLANASRRAQDGAQQALRQANALSRTLDGLKKALPADTTAQVPRPLVDSLLHAAEQRDSLRLAAIASLEIALRGERARAELALARVAAVEASLRATVKVADCRMLGFGPRCLSRTASLFVGAGVATAVLLR